MSGRRSVALGNTVPVAFVPVLAKHSKSLNLLDVISGGVDRMQRNFGPMQEQLESWHGTELTNVASGTGIQAASNAEDRGLAWNVFTGRLRTATTRATRSSRWPTPPSLSESAAAACAWRHYSLAPDRDQGGR